MISITQKGQNKNVGFPTFLYCLFPIIILSFAPAKSGVGGGIAVPLVDRMGIGVWGPSLNEKGNSIGGIKMLEYLSKKLDLSLF